jgi:hypothetical protein
MKDKLFCKILLLTTIFLMGILLGKIIDIPGITIDTKINPLHALSILVTFLIALLITVYFQTNKEINNAANSIIIKRIDKVIEILDILNELILDGSIEILKAPSITKRVYSSLNCIFQSIKENNINVTVDFKTVEDRSRKIKDLLTDTPAKIDTDTVAPIHIADNKYVYSSARVSELERQIEDLKNDLFRAQLEINKSFIS